MIQNLLLLFLIAGLCSCNSQRNFYSPSHVNNPFFQLKGDAKIAAYYSGGDGGLGNGHRDKNEGADFQAAYAVGENFAITGAFSLRRERDLYGADYFDTSTVNYKRNVGEIGVGYFVPMDRRSRVMFNLYGGVGWGKYIIRDEGMDAAVAYSKFHDAGLFKWYVQNSFNFFGKRVSVGFTARLTGMQFNNIKTNYDIDEAEYFSFQRVGKKMFVFFEPHYNMQYTFRGAEWLKLEAGFGLSGAFDDYFPAHRVINGSIGFIIDPSAIQKNKSAGSK